MTTLLLIKVEFLVYSLSFKRVVLFCLILQTIYASFLELLKPILD